jgi:hypothetical protein
LALLSFYPHGDSTSHATEPVLSRELKREGVRRLGERLAIRLSSFETQGRI